MVLLAALLCGVSLAATESAAHSAPPVLSTNMLSSPLSLYPLSLSMPKVKSNFGALFPPAASGSNLITGLSLNARTGKGVLQPQVMAALTNQRRAEAMTTNFLSIINSSVPENCTHSSCLFLTQVPWGLITRDMCLETFTSLETCLRHEASCQAEVLLKNPRACCENLQGGSGRSPLCGSDNIMRAITAGASAITASAAAAATASGKVRKAGKGGKTVKVEKAGKAVAPPTSAPTIAPSCICFESVIAPGEDVQLTRAACVNYVSELQQCMVDSGCMQTVEMRTLTACCDALPGGIANPDCPNPGAVFSSFLQFNTDIIPSELDLSTLMRLGGFEFGL